MIWWMRLGAVHYFLLLWWCDDDDDDDECLDEEPCLDDEWRDDDEWWSSDDECRECDEDDEWWRSRSSSSYLREEECSFTVDRLLLDDDPLDDRWWPLVDDELELELGFLLETCRLDDEWRDEDEDEDEEDGFLTTKSGFFLRNMAPRNSAWILAAARCKSLSFKSKSNLDDDDDDDGLCEWWVSLPNVSERLIELDDLGVDGSFNKPFNLSLEFDRLNVDEEDLWEGEA